MELSGLNVGERVAVNFFAKHGLRCERFTEQEMRQGKTPDFRVFKGAEFAAYSEAKHVQEDKWLEDQLKAAPPMTIVGGSRHDPAFNRLSGHIHEAAKQFEAVNPSHDYPVSERVNNVANDGHECSEPIQVLPSVQGGLFSVLDEREL
jgi:hypothetical protein